MSIRQNCQELNKFPAYRQKSTDFVRKKIGKKVPEEIAIIGINNSSLAEFSLPTLTSLDNSLKEMSAAAVGCIISSFSGEATPHKRLIPISLVEREST